MPAERRWLTRAVLAALLAAATVTSHRALGQLASAPWPARHRVGVRVWDEPLGPLSPPPEPGALSALRLRELGLRGGPRTRIPIERWPAEPPSPAHVDPPAFARALRALCPERVPDSTVERIARATLRAAETAAVDAFLLAALAYHHSGCEPRSHDSFGLGLTRINHGMHAPHVRDGHYHFATPRSGGFEPARISLAGHELTRAALLEPETHLFFAATFLRIAREQCPAIDTVFGSVPHRHAVSHTIFGDTVRSALPESLVLTARRRLLAYYSAHDVRVCPRCAERPQAPYPRFVSPLDGPPRIVTGVMGDPRDRGTRLHAGIDLMASLGEPVRAVAAGTVISAGVELKGRRLLDLPPERALEVPLGRMGPRGLFVRIQHEDGWISLYAHLARYGVRLGERVQRGQQIGAVGRTGVHASAAHLHFGLFEQARAVDPLVSLEPHVIAMERGFVLDFERLHEYLQGARRRP